MRCRVGRNPHFFKVSTTPVNGRCVDFSMVPDPKPSADFRFQAPAQSKRGHGVFLIWRNISLKQQMNKWFFGININWRRPWVHHDPVVPFRYRGDQMIAMDRNAAKSVIGHRSSVIGHGSWDIGHGLWVMGHGLWVIGHRSLGDIPAIDGEVIPPERAASTLSAIFLNGSAIFLNG